MINQIGTGKTGKPLVLAELNDAEYEAMVRILHLAESHLDEIPFPKVRNRRWAAEAMIKGMQEVFGMEKS